jgi:hypothetical protein
VINRLTGFICASLLIVGVAVVHAQQPPSDAGSDPQSQTQQPPAQPNQPQQQAPPTQQAPPSRPATQAEPTPSGQSPSQPVIPGPTGPNVQAPPELPKYPDVRLPGEYGFWVSVSGWEPQGQAIGDKGKASTATQTGYVPMQGKPKAAEGVEVGLALGLHNALRFSYFRARASGNYTNTADTSVPGQIYPAGTYTTTDWYMQDYKLSFDYLTWPYPVESRRIRLMTLWQFEYLNVRSGFDAPLIPTTDVNGNPLIGPDGNPITYASQSTKSIFSPLFGLGFKDYATKHLRFEINASGFAIPHHWEIYEADATANIRIGQIEIGFGGKVFHYKTSPQSDFYIRNTMPAPFVSVKWFSQ